MNRSARRITSVLVLALTLAVAILLRSAVAASETLDVDLELVLAADISDSMDPDEQALQRAGYALAFRDAEIVEAIRRGFHGRIAVTFIEWADLARPRVVVPWQVIDGVKSANAFAEKLEISRIGRMGRTSISGALLFAAHLIQFNHIEGVRRVIDVSGDGPNNQGGSVEAARDAVVAQDIVINGLPIQIKTNNPRNPFDGPFDKSQLHIYFEDCVIGGPGAFMVPIRDRSELVSGIRHKLFLEIAGREVQVVPAAYDASPRVPC